MTGDKEIDPVKASRRLSEAMRALWTAEEFLPYMSPDEHGVNSKHDERGIRLGAIRRAICRARSELTACEVKLRGER